MQQEITSFIMVAPKEYDQSGNNPWAVLNETKLLKQYFEKTIPNTLIIMHEHVWDAIKDKSLFKKSLVGIISTFNENDIIDEQEDHEMRVERTLEGILIWAHKNHPYVSIGIFTTMGNLQNVQKCSNAIQMIWVNGTENNANPLIESLSKEDSIDFAENRFFFHVANYKEEKTVSASSYRDYEAAETGY